MTISLDPIRPYLPLVYGGIALAVIVAFAVQGSRIKRLKRINGEQSVALVQYASAQKTNLDTIGKLTDANKAWEKNCAVDQPAVDAALKSLAQAEAEAERRIAAKTKEIEYVYVKSPAARAWRDSAVPRDIADRLP